MSRRPACSHAPSCVNAWVLPLTWILLCCQPVDPPVSPNIVLFVMDTVRADAVSAYGGIEGTTPTLDRLASEGVRYARAYSHAPWTLPSHATIFSGLLPSQHGVGWQRTNARGELVMLAERLQEAGYETFGVSENIWISKHFNMAQGFERLVSGLGVQVVQATRRWLVKREGDRPFFLFVNVIDPHFPYAVAKENPFLPSGVSAGEASSLPQDPAHYLCAPELKLGQLAVLKGLYLGEVSAADAKLGRVLGLLDAAGEMEATITIVTSDHGEHFGEHGLASHQFSVYQPLLHVPLVVHGLPDVEPAVVEEPVQQLDLVPTVLQWVGLEIPDSLPGRPLPTTALSAPRERRMIGEYSDPAGAADPEEKGLARSMRQAGLQARSDCPPNSRLFGDRRSVVRHPHKAIWFEHHTAELYDLEADPHEEHDLAGERPALLAELVDVISSPPPPIDAAMEPGAPARLPDDVRNQLEALGYVEESR